jgi:hypothetical protein
MYGFQYLEESPSLGSFNHMIVCVEDFNGNSLFLDATNKSSTWLTSYYPLIGQKVLILKEASSYTDQIRPDPFYQNRVITENKILRGTNSGEWTVHGKIRLSGECASDIYWALKNRENTQESTILSDALENSLKIKPSTVTLLSAEPYEVTASFEANFNHCILNAPELGIIFSQPDIHTPNYFYTDLTYEGDRYLYKVEQTDTWEIPKEFKKSNLLPFKNEYGEGHWVTINDKITRKYSCTFAHIKSEERFKLKKFLRERKEFAHGTIWSK